VSDGGRPTADRRNTAVGRQWSAVYFQGSYHGRLPTKRDENMIHEGHEGHKDKDMASCFFVYFVDFQKRF
jgi:hypothetical protein